MQAGVWSAVGLVLLTAGGAGRVVGAEITWHLQSGVFCAESTIENVGTSCGEVFCFARGRVSSPVLIGGDSLTVAIKTWMPDFSYAQPVYVELVATDSCSTRGLLPRYLLIAPHGTEACGGVWQSIGPVDLRWYLYPGERYTIQLTFIDTDPPPFGRSTAVSSLQVTTDSVVSGVWPSTWGDVKRLYR